MESNRGYYLLAGKKKYPTNNDSSEKADLKRQIQVYKKKKKKRKRHGCYGEERISMMECNTALSNTPFSAGLFSLVKVLC